MREEGPDCGDGATKSSHTSTGEDTGLKSVSEESNSEGSSSMRIVSGFQGFRVVLSSFSSIERLLLCRRSSSGVSDELLISAKFGCPAIIAPAVQRNLFVVG